jgi:hypothetical protein
VSEVECNEESTYKISSRGQKGVQAVVKQTLKYVSTFEGMNNKAIPEFVEGQINFGYDVKSTNEPNDSFNRNAFLDDLCARSDKKNGLSNEHSHNFRALVNSLEALSSADLLAAHQDAEKRCSIAG